MSGCRLAIKIDVDSARGTKEGVPFLRRLLKERGIPATFLFALGPDNTGRAIRRIFRPGFLKKVRRTNVIGTYGLRTLMNGVLWPGPRIAERHADELRAVADAGFEVGIHCWDHIYWQDKLARMTRDEVKAEFGRARTAFERVFGFPAKTAGAAGWQANQWSLAAYDEAGLDYASDARGIGPFFPSVNGRTFRTLQVPTTLPTLDELLGRPEYPVNRLVDCYLRWMKEGALNVMTVHAEIEGMAFGDWFGPFLDTIRRNGVRLVCLADEAERCRRRPENVPVMAMTTGTVDGRSGTLAVQGAPLSHPPSTTERAAAI